MNQALYRKYRSKKLSEIVGQEHITKALDNALKTGKISHAYLFTGPRGVGKTSIARILAHEINQLPYTDESTHLDIIEIDAASNRRIDEIRDLREKVHIAPTSAKYKVYIIDEVHMLTKEAFNALLKTLEEPPAHVVFILATTEAHKLPETIISRTQRYHFAAIDPEKVAEHLAEIAKKEGFKADADALKLIAEHGGGSFRDSIGLLDQIASGQTKAVTEEDVRQATGHASRQLILDIRQHVVAHNQAKLLTALQAARQDGISPKPLAHQIIAELRRDATESGTSVESLNLMQQLLEVESSTQPDLSLELILLRAALGNVPSRATKPKPEPVAENQAPPITESKPEPVPEKIAPVTVEHEAVKLIEEEPGPVASGEVQPFDTSIWISVLASVKSSNPSLYSVLRMADARSDDGTLSLHFKHGFHAKRLKEAKNQKIVADLLKTLTGEGRKIQAIHDPDATPSVSNQPIVPTPKMTVSIEAEQEPDSALATIMETFGGGEVVET